MAYTNKDKGAFILITTWKGFVIYLHVAYFEKFDLHLTENETYFINLSDCNTNILYDLSWLRVDTFRGYRNGTFYWNEFKMSLKAFSHFYTDWLFNV